MARKYPLEPLRRVRADAVDAKARALGDATRSSQAAVVARAERESERDLHADRIAELGRAERERLEQGALRAGDLLRGAAFEIQAEAERHALAMQVEAARSVEARKAEEREQARGVLSAAKADAEAVERHHAGWDAARRASVVAAEEEAAAEVHAARARGTRA